MALSGGRKEEGAQHAHERRLARAVGTEEAVDLARLRRQVDAVDGDGLAEDPSDPDGSDRWLRWVRVGRADAGARLVVLMQLFGTGARADCPERHGVGGRRRAREHRASVAARPLDTRSGSSYSETLILRPQLALTMSPGP